MHLIIIGTCGWSHKEWAGPFYPKGTKPADLNLDSERFPIVEVHLRYPGVSRRQLPGHAVACARRLTTPVVYVEAALGRTRRPEPVGIAGERRIEDWDVVVGARKVPDRVIAVVQPAEQVRTKHEAAPQLLLTG